MFGRKQSRPPLSRRRAAYLSVIHRAVGEEPARYVNSKPGQMGVAQRVLRAMTGILPRQASRSHGASSVMPAKPAGDAKNPSFAIIDCGQCFLLLFFG